MEIAGITQYAGLFVIMAAIYAICPGLNVSGVHQTHEHRRRGFFATVPTPPPFDRTRRRKATGELRACRS